ncbi:MAG TPA: methyltransferase domain-containing protein [Victivallales bacterium]|nr:methyltransferase domain-containing protein [Victivallales bacterium]HRR28464.1 methyltransferase domain-containing protein [Victivallales bacterium]HRU01182.1 methyltransferase domain-containing protein [Victivallales bacterium]
MTFSKNKILSEQVARNFSKAAFSYERAAKIQRDAAKKLFDFMQNNLPPNFTPNMIVELGAGTGFLTKLIVPNYTGTKILITDISEEMLYICRRKIASMTGYTDKWMIEFELLNFNADFEFPHDCGLVISGLSFQWAENLKDLIEKIYIKIKNGGFLCFSIITRGSLIELRQIFDLAAVRYPVPNHYDEEEIQKILSIFPEQKFETYSVEKRHPNIIQFLSSLKNVGAINPGNSRLTPIEMRKIFKLAPKGEFKVTYKISNFLCKK